MKIYLNIQMGLIMLLGISISASNALANVNVNINIGPPPVEVAAPSELVFMPAYGIYFSRGVNFDVFFYNGYWWSPRGPRWYRARQYEGPWGRVQHAQVPVGLFKVPKNYRVTYQKERAINYGQWKKQHGPSQGNNYDRGQNHQEEHGQGKKQHRK